MAHDAHGNLLAVGDQVVIPGRVKAIYSDGGLLVESEVTIPGEEGCRSAYPVAAAQVEKAFTSGIETGDEERGRVTYAGYSAATGGKSPFTGNTLPGWEKLAPRMQAAWIAAAAAARDRVIG